MRSDITIDRSPEGPGPHHYDMREMVGFKIWSSRTQHKLEQDQYIDPIFFGISARKTRKFGMQKIMFLDCC